jgi:hypothetical protein
MPRIVGSVLAGYIAVGILVALTDLIFAAAIPGFRAMAAPPLYYFVIVTFTDTIYTIGGGYLCAATARASARTATLGLMICGEIAGVVSTVLGWHIQPHWFALALLALFPLAVWIGYKLRVRGAEPSMVSGAV